MSPADLITLPDAVSRAALVTELAVFESLSRGPTELPALSTKVRSFIRRHRATGQVYSRTAWSLDEFVEEFIGDGYIERRADGLALTSDGNAKLDSLRGEARREGVLHSTLK